MPIKYLRAPATAARTPLAAQIRRDFGALVDPFLLHAPAPAIMAGVWMACRESELVGRVPRAAKEAVAAAVSRLNQCPYCVDAHAVMLHALDRHAAADHLRTGRGEPPRDPALRAVIAWAAATRSPGAPILRDPPFAADAAPEIIGTAVFYHYINRMVSVLLDPSPLPLVPAPLTGATARAAGWWFRLAARRPKAPGAALVFLPAAELPADMAWASTGFQKFAARSTTDDRPPPARAGRRSSVVHTGNGLPGSGTSRSANVAGAFARLAASVEAAGARALAEPVRAMVKRELAGWGGEAPGLGRAWLETPISELPPELRPAGRLALLTALAPYQVDAETVAAFQVDRPNDTALIGALAWASLTAARRVGTWLWPAT